VPALCARQLFSSLFSQQLSAPVLCARQLFSPFFWSLFSQRFSPLLFSQQLCAPALCERQLFSPLLFSRLLCERGLCERPKLFSSSPLLHVSRPVFCCPSISLSRARVFLLRRRLWLVWRGTSAGASTLLVMDRRTGRARGYRSRSSKSAFCA